MATTNQTIITEKYNAWFHSSKEFDKAISFIASGALGLSFAFIDKIVDLRGLLQHKELLTRSWYMFAAVIFLSMVSHYISIEVNRWTIENHVDGRSTEKDRNKYKKRTTIYTWNNRILRYIKISLLLLGFFHLIGFIEWNL